MESARWFILVGCERVSFKWPIKVLEALVLIIVLFVHNFYLQGRIYHYKKFWISRRCFTPSGDMASRVRTSLDAQAKVSREVGIPNTLLKASGYIQELLA
uniref:Uncharacterized protein n=1 Tax=Cucumis melo TaxID=3656 RepID=A0A9I9E9F8_CUCME